MIRNIVLCQQPFTRYRVAMNMCYQLGEYYQTTFSATRPYSPRDKAMVEKAVNIVYNHIYATFA